MLKLLCCGIDEITDKDPVVDIERLLVDFVWKKVMNASWLDNLMRDRRYQFDVNWSYLDISHRIDPDQPEVAGQPHDLQGEGVARRDACLFRTEFVNTSNVAQNFTFKTERTTTSRCNITLQRGIRIGAKVDIRLSLPAAVAVRMSGTLSRELHVTETTGQTFEDVLTWGVDSQVRVDARSRTTAELTIREEELKRDVTIESVIRPLGPRIPIKVRSRKTGQTLKVRDIESTMLPGILSGDYDFSRVDPNDPNNSAVRRKTKGVLRLVYGAEQIVNVKTCRLDSPVEVATSTRSLETPNVDVAHQEAAKPPQ